MAEFRGRILLKECEEGSLEELLNTVRTTISTETHSHRLPLPLASLTRTRPAAQPLTLTGQTHGLPLLYHILYQTLSTPDPPTVAILDFSHSFDPSQLSASTPFSALQHIHIFRPARPASSEELGILLDGVRKYMLYGEHGSRGREFWGVVVIDAGVGLGNGSMAGAIAGEILLACGYRGEVKVGDGRGEVLAFAMGTSAEEAWGEREARREEVEKRGWWARWEGGNLNWEG